MKNKRILWLLNHTTLRDFEVPLLEKLGFEVFIPKIIPFDEANQSASVTFTYDSKLTIEPTLLEEMNTFNFYEQKWPKSLEKKINENFNVAFVPVFPEMVETIVNSFRNQIFFRGFGLEEEKTYADRFKSHLSAGTFNRIKQDKSIWLAVGYDCVIDHEPEWIRQKSIHLPLGLPETYNSVRNIWIGNSENILFICPRINSNPYYNKVYNDFKNHFGKLPHKIVGAQPVPVEDDNVLGYLDTNDYKTAMIVSKVMFYHSTEERHLHYHPIEAILYGMPVVFMAGGMLEYLAGKQLPGCCFTIEEASNKVHRILQGDDKLIDEIKQSQIILLNEFNSNYVEQCWRERFLPIINSLQQSIEKKDQISSETSPIHIGIWIHEANENGFTGEGISRLIANLICGIQNHKNVIIHLASVSWVKNAIIDYMGVLGVNTENLVFEHISEKPPIIYTLYKWFELRKVKPYRRIHLSELLKPFLPLTKSLLGILFIARSFATYFFVGLMIIIFSPVLLFFVIIYYLLKAIQIIIEKISQKIKIETIDKLINNFSVGVFPFVYNQMVDTEMQQLSKKVGKKKEIVAWYFAYPNVKYINNFLSAKIVAVPDIVYLDFPSLYSRGAGEIISKAHLQIFNTIKSADSVITYSEYVKQEHVIKQGLQKAKNVYKIQHANINTCELLASRRDVNNYQLHILAKRIIKSYIREMVSDDKSNLSKYLLGLDFGEFDFLFVSSQSRLHKNHLNLIKAFKILLREKYRNLKLVFTGKFTPDMDNYINAERLHLDVLSFNKLPPQVHAAFYECAVLTVVPTLFEGGFPFVFSESLSVGTPVVLSNIPVVQEILPPMDLELFTVNPYNVQNMAEKIEWVLNNYGTYVGRQMEIFRSMSSRTWDEVAEEYLEVFLKTKMRK